MTICLPRRYVLCLDESGLTVFRRRMRALFRDAHFPADESGRNQFSAYLGSHKHGRFQLLVDLPDEVFHQETIPLLPAAERRAIITRRRAQTFPGDDLVAAFSLGHENTRRRNEHVVLAAMTGADRIVPWLKLLEDTGHPRIAVHSRAFADGVAAKLLGAANGQCLLLTVTRHAVRQSLIDTGRTRFSRCTPITPGNDGTCIGISLSAEISRLLQYLRGRHLLEPGNPVRVVVLADDAKIPEIATTFADRFPSGDAVVPELHSLTDFVKQLGPVPSEGLHTDSLSAFLGAQLLVRGRGQPRYHQTVTTTVPNRAALLRSIRFIGTCALVFVSAVAAGHYSDARKLDQANAELRSETVKLERQLAAMRSELSQALAHAPANAETYRQLSGPLARLETPHLDLEPFLRELGAVLSAAPQITLESIDWRNDAPDSSRRDSSGTAVSVPELLIYINCRLEKPTAEATASPSAAFKHFVELLREHPGWSVDTRRQPTAIDEPPVFPGNANRFGLDIRIRET